MYNRYVAGKRYVQYEPGEKPAGQDRSRVRQGKPAGSTSDVKIQPSGTVVTESVGEPRRRTLPERKRPSGNISGGLERVLSSALPGDMDAGDLLLIAVLFLLYVESRDEDFLIILGALIVTFFDII